jgi:hypothetical protein
VLEDDHVETITPGNINQGCAAGSSARNIPELDSFLEWHIYLLVFSSVEVAEVCALLRLSSGRRDDFAESCNSVDHCHCDQDDHKRCEIWLELVHCGEARRPVD